MRKVSKNFYLISWIGAGILLLFLYLTGWIAGIHRGWEAWLGATYLGIIPGIYLSIVGLVFLYKAWASIQDGQTPVSPGKAVGFLFIPFYNFYWIFRAVWGLAREFNKYLGRHSLSIPRLPEGLFLVPCVLALAGPVLLGFVQGIEISLFQPPLVTGGLSVTFSIVGLIITGFIINEVCDRVNALVGIQEISMETGTLEISGQVDGLASTKETGPLSLSVSHQLSCPQCGASVSGGSRFCSECGAALREVSKPPLPPQVSCPHCRASLTANTRFCSNCGATLHENRAVPTAGPVRLLAVGAAVRRSGDRTSFQFRVEGENAGGEEARRGGVTINIPVIDESIIAQTEVTAWAAGAERTYWNGPGQTILGFREDGSFGEIAADCLLIETVHDRWKPGERLCLEASVVAPLERLEIHVRTWATWKKGDDTEETWGDPDWSLAESGSSGIALDQQRIPACRLLIGF